jgi:ABC-type transport system involved in multi-copper enzyme maturation permease subunit
MSSAENSGLLPRAGMAGWLFRSGPGRLLLGVLAALVLLVEGAALFWATPSLSGGAAAGLWGQWLLCTAALVLGFASLLCGPVFFFDLVRMTRRGRYFLVRTAYALGLLVILFLIWWNQMAFHGAGPLNPAQMADFANLFFCWFMIIQFGMVALLTPAYTAGAIAEEKERRTLEFVLATDLRNHEVVLGKLASRLVNLGFVVLTGLPILALLQLLGGVDPGLMATGFAATVVTILSLAALSILFSTMTRRARDAIILTYLAVPAYLAVGGLAFLLLVPPGWADFPSTGAWHSPVTLKDVVEWFNAGNLVYAFIQVVSAYGGGTLSTVLAGVLGRYALFHGLVVLGCCVAAVLRVRRAALAEQVVRVRKPGPGARRRRPSVSGRPMVWKELHAERGFRLHWFGRILVGVLVGASFIPLWLIVDDHLSRGTSDTVLAEQMNAWVRGVGTGVACLLLLGVAVRAVGGVSGERERQTLDSLLTSPLEGRDILYGKWLGSVLGLRWIWVWLGAIWLLGLITGGLSPLALPFLVGGWFVFAGFTAALGLWYSTVCRTTLRATLWTFFTLVVVWLSHWLVWMCCMPFFIALAPGSPGSFVEYVLPRLGEFQAFTLTPPATLGFLAFRLEDFESLRGSASEPNWGVEFLACSLLGMVVWGVAARAVWTATVDRFNQLMGRVPVRHRPPVARDEGSARVVPAAER